MDAYYSGSDRFELSERDIFRIVSKYGNRIYSRWSHYGRLKKAIARGNLPAGEVYIPPAPMKVEGKIVLDGSIKNRQGCQLLKRPINLFIEKGKIVEINGDGLGKELDKDLDWAESIAKRPDNVRKIGEIGIGTNPQAKVIGPTIINEKALGTAHVAIGSNAWFGGDIRTFVHLDQVFYEPIIRIDGKVFNDPRMSA